LAEGEDIIRQTKLEASDAIERIKKAELKESRESLRELNKRQAEIKQMRKQYEPEKMKVLEKAREGQRVFVISLGTEGTVQSVNEKTGKCKVLVNEKEITLSVKELSQPLTDNNKKQKNKEKGRETYFAALTSKDLHTPDEINVVGKRVDPALSIIERYLNDVSLSGLSEVKVIHGIGKGILASAIREYLSDHPLVQSFRAGDEYEGGGGVTVVTLKE
jgi:DNA mismatch repair protein MutS2